MLVLTRKISESIMIGQDVCITLLKQQGNQIKIGIAAPENLPVYRKELLSKMEDGFRHKHLKRINDYVVREETDLN